MNREQSDITNIPHSEIKNKGFLILDSIFKNNNWDLIINEMNHITYGKFGDETTNFDIRILRDRITASIPVKNSVYQYTTSFNSYFEASEYIEHRFYDYIN